MNKNEVISVDMGECIILDESDLYLETDGLGPCVGVAIVIKTNDGKVHRLLGHIVMEEKELDSFNELKISIKEIKKNTANNVNDIEISFTTTQSYRNRGYFTKDEKKLLKIIEKEFNFRFKDIKFYYSQKIQISPDGSILYHFIESENNDYKMKRR